MHASARCRAAGPVAAMLCFERCCTTVLPRLLHHCAALGAASAAAQVSLFDVMPTFCVADLVNILQEYARDS